MVTLKMYGDESADETRSRVFAVAGVVGSDAEWSLATREWLRRTRGLPFHATDCESEFVRHPDRHKHKDNLKLYADLAQILAGSYLVGFAVALDLRTHGEMFPGVVPDWAYFKCLSDVISAAARTAKTFNGRPEEEDDVRLEFTFDSRLESDGTAKTLYTMFSQQPEWADAGILDTKIVLERGPEPRLEMADLLARESMKELDRKITQARRNVRGARRALEETGKFHFIERDREYWESLRELIARPESAQLMDDWNRWLTATGRVQNGRPHQNMSNWILFNAWLDKGAIFKESADAGV